MKIETPVAQHPECACAFIDSDGRYLDEWGDGQQLAAAINAFHGCALDVTRIDELGIVAEMLECLTLAAKDLEHSPPGDAADAIDRLFGKLRPAMEAGR